MYRVMGRISAGGSGVASLLFTLDAAIRVHGFDYQGCKTAGLLVVLRQTWCSVHAFQPTCRITVGSLLTVDTGKTAPAELRKAMKCHWATRGTKNLWQEIQP